MRFFVYYWTIIVALGEFLSCTETVHVPAVLNVRVREEFSSSSVNPEMVDGEKRTFASPDPEV